MEHKMTILVINNKKNLIDYARNQKHLNRTKEFL